MTSILCVFRKCTLIMFPGKASEKTSKGIFSAKWVFNISKGGWIYFSHPLERPNEKKLRFSATCFHTYFWFDIFWREGVSDKCGVQIIKGRSLARIRAVCEPHLEAKLLKEKKNVKKAIKKTRGPNCSVVGVFRVLIRLITQFWPEILLKSQLVLKTHCFINY
jgi:hypothetical protein